MAGRRNRWRPRFSLRSLAIVMTLAAVIAAWFTQSALRQRRAVAERNRLRQAFPATAIDVPDAADST